MQTRPKPNSMLSGFSWIEEGKVAGMRRPGSLHPLDQDLRDLKEAGVGAVVSLTDIALESEILKTEDLAYLRIPVPDFQPPTISDVRQAVAFIDSCLAEDRPVVIHCTAGLGRTGTMLACWLVSQGTSPGSAIFKVRSSRPGSIETPEQEQRVFEFADFLAGLSE